MSETMRSASPPYHYHLITVYTDCQACIRDRALSAARDEVVRACGPLVAALEATREATDAAFHFAALHGQVYSGPTYEAEFNAARDAVAALARLEKP